MAGSAEEGTCPFTFPLHVRLSPLPQSCMSAALKLLSVAPSTQVDELTAGVWVLNVHTERRSPDEATSREAPR